MKRPNKNDYVDKDKYIKDLESYLDILDGKGEEKVLYIHDIRNKLTPIVLIHSLIEKDRVDLIDKTVLDNAKKSIEYLAQKNK